MTKIVTSHIRPPIPTRDHDWCAWFDGEEERSFYGYGPTELDAINDLLLAWPDHAVEMLTEEAA